MEAQFSMKAFHTNTSAVDLSLKDTDINDSHEEVGNDSNIVSFPFFGFCGRPIESVQDVLTKGGEEPIGHLTVD